MFRTRIALLASLTCLGCEAHLETSPTAAPKPEKKLAAQPRAQPPKKPFTIRKQVANGCIEDHNGLRVIRLWGTPEERGTAQGQLVGAEAIDLMRRELVARFAARQDLLNKARGLLNLMVAYPRAQRREIQALFAAIEKQGIDCSCAEIGRKLDVTDALALNAMDLLVQIGCSGFTVWGDRVAGGGVLTARNFDWPMTGPYLVENCCVIVQHPDDGAAFASIAWPGYVGVVTGVSVEGVAAFLHFGDSAGGWPRPGSYSSATAAREILQQADGESAFEVARDLLAKTSPPRGYLTRVIRPMAGSKVPVRVFEVDSKGVTHRSSEELCVVTNHFLSRGARDSFMDSRERFDTVTNCLKKELGRSDRKVSVDEAWATLASVERDGARFGTQHSLVFRPDPWVFEVAIGQLEGGELQAAPSKGKRYRVAKEALFRDPR